MWRRTHPLYGGKRAHTLRGLKRAAWVRLATETECLRENEEAYRLMMGGLTLKERLDLISSGHTRDKREAQTLLNTGLQFFRKKHVVGGVFNDGPN